MTKRKTIFFERSKVFYTLLLCVACFLNIQWASAQNQITVKGVVNDAMGPVIGANIVEKDNPTNGTITDIDGNFSLSVAS